MKNILLALLCIINGSFIFSQKTEAYTIVKERVSKSFFKTPEKAKKDAYILKQIAKTGEEIETAYKYLGYIYDLTGKSDSARYYLSKRLDFNKEHFTNDTLYYEAVISYSNWGLEHIDSEILITELTTALSKITIKEHKQQKGLMFLLLGDVFLRENDLENANTYFDKAFKLIEGKYVLIDYYLRKGKIAILKNDYINAERFLNKGISIDEAKTTYTYPNFLNMLGYISIMRGKLTQANTYLKQSLHYQETNNFKTFTAKTYLHLALLAKVEESNSEKEMLVLAQKYSNNDPVVTKGIYLAYKDYYSRNGDFTKEQMYLNKFNKLNDSIFNTEKSKIKLDLEWKYKLSESKKELIYNKQIISDDSKIKKLYAISLLLLILLITVLIIVYRIKIKIHKRNREIQKLLHEEQLKSNLENQKTEIIKEKIKAKVNERERLSLELHDGIANEISALKLSLSTSKTTNVNTIDSVVDKIDKLYNEVRNLSHDLNPASITDVEFSQLVDRICIMAENTGITVTKNIIFSKRIDELDERILLSIYRVLQELINNLIKHSKATKATIEVIEVDTTLLIEISDNGVGFGSAKKTGIGLKNIKKRISLLNGVLSISSEDGTSVKIKIPIK